MRKQTTSQALFRKAKRLSSELRSLRAKALRRRRDSEEPPLIVKYAVNPLTKGMPDKPAEADGLASNLEMTLREWIELYQRETVFERVPYRGVLAWKNVLDLWMTRSSMCVQGRGWHYDR